MCLISSAAEVNTLAEKEPDTGGVYFVTAFSGLLAPYWDPGAAGLLIGMPDLSNFNPSELINTPRHLTIHQPFAHRPRYP